MTLEKSKGHIHPPAKSTSGDHITANKAFLKWSLVQWKINRYDSLISRSVTSGGLGGSMDIP